MSAFFIWLELSGQSIDESIARSMLSELDGFGGDAKDLLLNKNVAIGTQLRWTTPEDRGQIQPLYNANETECFVFDGRIDNREHLIAELGVEAEISDPSLIFGFLTRFGRARLAEVVGPFVFVLFDMAKGHVLCGRDAMGGRYLSYRCTKDRLIIASSERAFMAHPDVEHKLNEAKVAAWLINHSEHEHTACLAGVSTLNPGCLLEWSARSSNRAEITTFYRPSPSRRVRLSSDRAYATEFRRLLDQAVMRRVRCNGKVGSMLSGGMDSVPVTISAASSDVDTIAYSWVFDDSPEMDERQYSAPLCEQLGITQQLIQCDSVWPALDETTHCNPLFPLALHYSEFNQQTFRRAHDDGVTVMLTGLHGDLLYCTDNKQVIHALSVSGVAAAIKEFASLKKHFRLSLWSAIKRFLIAPVTWAQAYIDNRRLATAVESEILVPEKLALLKKGWHWLYQESQEALRPLQYRIVMDGFAGEDAMLGRHMENKFAIERRYPFRDRDLCEFMLGIPTAQLEKLGVKRPIVKRAYDTEFSRELKERNDKTRFVDSLYDGLKRDKNWQSILVKSPQAWQNYVKDCNIYENHEDNDLNAVVKWQCAYYNFWHSVWYRS